MDTLYVSNTCPHCHRVYNFIQGLPLAAQNVVVRNITMDPAAMNDLLAMGFKNVPLLVTDARGSTEAFLGDKDIMAIINGRYGQVGGH